jgi:HAD superfamily hydrolase (TIGR01509 family)
LTSPARSAITLPGPFAAVVFDMDGLLMDTVPLWAEAKRIVFGRRGLTFQLSDQRAIHGAGEDQVAAYFARRFGAPEAEIPAIRDEYMLEVERQFEGPVHMNPGAAELVGRLAGRAPLALASNSKRSLVDMALADTPFPDRFDAIATGDEATPKPAPDVYLLACRRLGLDPAGAVAVEDSPLGVAAAKAAGMTCIGVPSDPAGSLAEADFVVESLTELL